MEIKIEIKKWFKLGFLDKIIKQIAFFDFCHFCEICEARVAHETRVAHHISYLKHFILKQILNILKNEANSNHADFVLIS